MTHETVDWIVNRPRTGTHPQALVLGVTLRTSKFLKIFVAHVRHSEDFVTSD